MLISWPWHMPGAVVRSADDIGRLAWRSALSCFRLYLRQDVKSPCRSFSETDHDYSKAAVGYERIREVLEMNHEVTDLPGARTRPAFREGSSSNESTSAMSRTAGRCLQRKPTIEPGRWLR